MVPLLAPLPRRWVPSWVGRGATSSVLPRPGPGRRRRRASTPPTHPSSRCNNLLDFMTKTELESKHLAELHSLAADAGVPGYRMLRREELIEKLGDGKPAKSEKPRGEKPRGERPPRRERSPRDRPPRQRRERPARKEPAADSPAAEPAAERQAPPAPVEPPAPASQPVAEGSSRPKRKRRRRRFGRKSRGLRAQDLLLPPPGRQALVYGESRGTCTSLLREIAAELAGASEGPDPIALLIDPSPEELADWKREAPDAELVVA